MHTGASGQLDTAHTCWADKDELHAAGMKVGKERRDRQTEEEGKEEGFRGDVEEELSEKRLGLAER